MQKCGSKTGCLLEGRKSVAAKLAAVGRMQRVTAKLAACWKRCGSRTGCLLERCKCSSRLAARCNWCGRKYSSLFEECKGVAAELAACWKRCKGVMAGPAPSLSEETSKMALPYLAWAWRQLVLERLCRHTTNPVPAPSAKRANVAVRVGPANRCLPFNLKILKSQFEGNISIPNNGFIKSLSGRPDDSPTNGQLS
ncbi:hypothetical protein B0J14DRAFT_172592 [Halenospora varia]|nr:hypothetical protein B0J14DRAFT_172592 [Halenospora varia]